MTPVLHLDISFDLICPWCWIGKQNLETALDLVRHDMPALVVNKNWHSVQLLPDTPEAGVPFERFYEQRLGSQDAVILRRMQVNHAAALAGLQVHFERIETFPNTAKAHRLLKFIKATGTPSQYDAMLRALFEAYFVDGKNIGDQKALLDIAAMHGLDAASVAVALNSTARDISDRPSISGVPHFLLNEKRAIFGAQAPEMLTAAILDFLNEDNSYDTSLQPTE